MMNRSQGYYNFRPFNKNGAICSTEGLISILSLFPGD